ncbi:PKD domain-containing protein [Micromonospora profundi]|uniref:PKD domain-containing protein n=1 Tax=Micromonospora profundi TaxID=1420889 RepID=UPI00367727BD
MRRWFLPVTILTSMLVGLIPGSPAHAEPSPDQTTRKLVAYVISDPDLIEHPERVSEEFRKNLNLDNLGVKPATADGPSESTRARPRAAAAGPESYVVDSGRFPRGSLPDDVYDYATREQCEEHSDEAKREQGWIKNRYSYCQSHMVYIGAVECGLFPPSCRLSGEYLSQNMLRGEGKQGGHINDPSKLRWASFTLEVEVLWARGVFSAPTAKMKAAIECDGGYRDPVFDVDDDYACFPGPDDDTEKTIPGWRANNYAFFELMSDAREPAAANGEQIATGVFHIEYDFDLPGWYFQFVDTESEEGGMRFDSAWYLSSARARQLGSVFDRAVPGIFLSTTDPAIKGAAVHIEEARANPPASWPPNPNKVLPGATASDPLHRIPRAKSAEHRFRADRNRTVSTNTCARTSMPPPPDDPTVPNWDCDEYPIAATYEGSAGPEFHDEDLERGRPVQLPDNYSVRFVARAENQEAGGRIGIWMENDRLLDYDNLFIPVGDGNVSNPPPDNPDVDDSPVVSAGPDRRGNEGSPVGLNGSARDDGGAPSTRWSYTAGSDVDAGATCAFEDAGTPVTTISCTDDGTFTVTLTADDGVNGAVSDSATVTLSNVAPSLRETPAPSPLRAAAAAVAPTQWPVHRARTAFELKVPFNDPGTNDTHTCTVVWDDGRTESVTATNNVCQATHTFTDAGMYTIDVTVRDDDAAADTSGSMIVVYDPDAGTANIDGSTATPAGALVSEPNAAGQTWLHNTAQYQSSSATAPVGQGKAWTDGTSFRLEPSSMEWLVLTKDGKVASRGTGTLNGRSGYTWVIYGWDACSSGRTDCVGIPTDRARLVVFETATGTVVYDHSPGSTEFDVDRIAPRDLTSGAVQLHRTGTR